MIIYFKKNKHIKSCRLFIYQAIGENHLYKLFSTVFVLFCNFDHYNFTFWDIKVSVKKESKEPKREEHRK